MSKEAMVGLEFETGSEECPPENGITRCCFRIPVSKSDRFSIRIGKTVYSMVNIQTSGVSFRTRAEGEYFPVEKELINAMITLDDQVFNVRAQVMHVSDDGEENPLCGLRFIELDKGTAEALSAFYEVLWERLLLNKGGTA